ncbi:hypothetical protein NDU88_000001 [Pleurodeles waltl]|uniref:Uncharacterized protein n=1 Tax=Pleurodeles waltl TaxID=8319 RepID=A0AAV7KNF2_PLEWA|nr:hypothetical protein NDU88_000001 [Pleurodeles waltl]
MVDTEASAPEQQRQFTHCPAEGARRMQMAAEQGLPISTCGIRFRVGGSRVSTACGWLPYPGLTMGARALPLPGQLRQRRHRLPVHTRGPSVRGERRRTLGAPVCSCPGPGPEAAAAQDLRR